MNLFTVAIVIAFASLVLCQDREFCQKGERGENGPPGDPAPVDIDWSDIYLNRELTGRIREEARLKDLLVSDPELQETYLQVVRDEVDTQFETLWKEYTGNFKREVEFEGGEGWAFPNPRKIIQF